MNDSQDNKPPRIKIDSPLPAARAVEEWVNSVETDNRLKTILMIFAEANFKLTQDGLGEIFGLSQEAVSQRIKRANEAFARMDIEWPDPVSIDDASDEEILHEVISRGLLEEVLPRELELSFSRMTNKELLDYWERVKEQFARRGLS